MQFIVRIALALVATVAAALPASAQTFPSRNITLVVGYAPGGTGDFIARLVGNKLGEKFGRTVVVENRAGASGAIAAQFVANAAPDGYTILAGQTPEIAINPHFMKGNLDVERDLVPVALGGVVPLALVVPKDAPFSTVPDMLKAAQSAKGLLFASAGTGTPGHFAGELLKLRTASRLTHVPYKGAGPALNDLVGGHVDMFFSGFPAAAPQVKAGTLKLLAVSSGTRSTAAPDAPTVAEAANIKDFDITLWAGFFAPRATPDAIVARLNGEINRILQLPDIKGRLEEDGAEIRLLTPDALAGFMRTESDKYLRIIKETGVTSD
jgi:tripartite-type tricarboxylate transporter receptor subunit TctC